MTAGFAGRRRELAALGELLPASAGRQHEGATQDENPAAPPESMAAISGMAGAGKTALAIWFCRQMADRFPDGQLFLDLRGFDRAPAMSPGEALGRILRSLGTDASQMPSDAEEQAEMYRSVMAHRRMIVLLDNAASVEQVRLLLPGAPECLVIVTSRRSLTGLVSRYGARHITLDALSPPESLEVFGAVVGRARVAEERKAALDLAGLCGHLPLALRLAAAVLAVQPARPIAELAAELAVDRLRELEVEEGPAISAAFDLSYRRLDGPAARMFRLLGLIPGPHFTTASAAAIAGETEELAGRLLADLSSMHLVELYAAGRYRFHDLVRLFAVRLSHATDPALDQNQALSRLLAYYSCWADTAARSLYPYALRLAVPLAAKDGGLDAARALGWLEDERPNCVAAIRAWPEQPAHAAAAYQLADALHTFLEVRAYTNDWPAIAEAGLAAALRTGDVLAETAMRRSLADSILLSGRYPEAEAEYERALHASRACGWRAAEAEILSALAVVAGQRVSPALAIANYRRALLIYKDMGDSEGAARTMCRLGGDLLWKLGKLEQGSRYLTKVLAVSRESGSRMSEVSALINLGNVSHEMGNLEEALGYLTTALTVSKEIGSRIGEAISMCDLGGVNRDLGHFDRALECGSSALEHAREIGNIRVEAECLNALADYHLRTGSPDAAAYCAREALRLASGHGHRYTRVRALNRLAAAALDSSDLDSAAMYCTSALEIAKSAGYRMLEGIALTVYARLALTRLEHARATELANQAVTILRKTGHRQGEATARDLLAKASRPTSLSQQYLALQLRVGPFELIDAPVAAEW